MSNEKTLGQGNKQNGEKSKTSFNEQMIIASQIGVLLGKINFFCKNSFDIQAFSSVIETKNELEKILNKPGAEKVLNIRKQHFNEQLIDTINQSFLKINKQEREKISALTKERHLLSDVEKRKHFKTISKITTELNNIYDKTNQQDWQKKILDLYRYINNP